MNDITYLIKDPNEDVKKVALGHSFFKMALKNINNFSDKQITIIMQLFYQLGSMELLKHVLGKIEGRENLLNNIKADNDKVISYKILEFLGFDIGDASKDASPVEEVKKKIKQIQIKNRGVSLTKRGNYKIEPNTLAKYLTKRILAVRDSEGDVYVYDQGIYREIKETDLKTICRDILNEVDATIWKKKFEREYIDAFKMEISKIDNLESSKNKMAFKNGYFDLEKGKFFNFSPKIYFEYKLRYKYDSEAKAKRFEQFLDEIFEKDGERIQLVKEILGYLLLEDRKIHKMYIFKGSGSNGKSVLIKIIQGMLGVKNVSTTPLKKLEGRFGLQDLEGKLVNISSENELGGKNIDTENIKAITGGDLLEVEKKNQDAFTTNISTRLTASVNNDFYFTDSSHSILRRLLFIPFNVCFYEKPENPEEMRPDVMYQDNQLQQCLLGELSGIFNIAFKALQELKDNDYVYTSSKACKKELERYIRYANPIMSFMEDELDIGADYEIDKPELNRLFDRWQKSHGGEYKSISSTKAARLVEKALKKSGDHVLEKKVSGQYVLEGIRARKKEIVNDSSDIPPTGKKLSSIG